VRAEKWNLWNPGENQDPGALRYIGASPIGAQNFEAKVKRRVSSFEYHSIKLTSLFSWLLGITQWRNKA
jgi:hypothetical protein